jgi:DNA polymerase-3 subunit gamma/tau
MSQLVLARKYRPRSFSEMVGQDHVVQALGNALNTGRLHHAYMFTGTRGVGKTTVSRILAKSLNCLGADGQGGITATPCGVCLACTDIDLGRFVDYTELDAASNRGVDEVQGLLEQAVYKPVQGRFKVFMIDEVHMLTGHAFNAMLKTLEEPPPYLKFVLATTDPQKVPVTVLSRCLQFNLKPIAPQTVFEHLQKVLVAEGLQAEDAALSLLAKGARGSMRDALSLLDQAIAYGGVSDGQPLSEQSVRQMLSAVDSRHVVSLLDAVARRDGATVVALCDQLRTEGLSAGAALEELTHLLQRMAVMQVGGEQSFTEAVDADLASTADLAQRLPADVLHLMYSLVLQGRSELALAPDEHAALMMLVLRALVFMPKEGFSTTAEPEASRSAGVSAPLRVSIAQAVVPVARPPVPTRPAPVVASAAASDQPKSVTSQKPAEPLPWDEENTSAAAGTAKPSALVEEVSFAPLVSSPATPSTNPPAISTPVAPLVRQLPVKVQAEPSARTEQLSSAAKGVRPEGAELALTAQGDFWLEVVKDLIEQERVTALVRELALQSQLLGRDDMDAPVQRWQLRTERESLAQNSHKERLEAALAASGRAVQLSLEVGPVNDSPAKRLAAQQAETMARAEQVIQGDEFVHRMMRDFGAKLVPGSLQVQPKP